MEQQLHIPERDVRKLLSAACPEAALLYLYLRAGNSVDSAASLGLEPHRLDYAKASLQQLGLLEASAPVHLQSGEAPVYTEADIQTEYAQGREFPDMVGETQRRLGRTLSTEELKILLSVYRYLGIGPEVLSILVNFCIRRTRENGSNRMPSVRSIEKEAYRWADLGIETMEQAAAYTQQQLRLQARSAKIASILQFSGRRLSVSEEKYVRTWIEWGFTDDAIALAYDKTCVNAGGMKWAYMNAILQSWKEQGLLNAKDAEQGDRKASSGRQSGVQQHGGALSEVERAAVNKMMQKKFEEA